MAAFNHYGKDGFLLRSRPGGPRLSGQWLELHGTVVGVARANRLAGVSRVYRGHPLVPPRMACCYNPWWTLPKRFNERELLALAGELKRQLFDKHGLFFDVVAPDAGWAKLQSIWETDPLELPQGFARVRQIVESAGGRLGLWISPSSIYPISVDYDWAQDVATSPWFASGRLGGRPSPALLIPNYRRKTEEELRRLVRAIVRAYQVRRADLLRGSGPPRPAARRRLG